MYVLQGSSFVKFLHKMCIFICSFFFFCLLDVLCNDITSQFLGYYINHVIIQLIYFKKLHILYTINLCMLWSKNQKIIYYYPIVCKCFFVLQCHIINIKNQSTPGAHAVFLVGGVWTCFEGCAMQSLFSENVYENQRVGSYRGYVLENFVISTNA